MPRRFTVFPSPLVPFRLILLNSHHPRQRAISQLDELSTALRPRSPGSTCSLTPGEVVSTYLIFPMSPLVSFSSRSQLPSFSFRHIVFCVLCLLHFTPTTHIWQHLPETIPKRSPSCLILSLPPALEYSCYPLTSAICDLIEPE